MKTKWDETCVQLHANEHTESLTMWPSERDKDKDTETMGIVGEVGGGKQKKI